MTRSRVATRGPEAIDADAQIAAMRAAREFRHPWIVAPTDREAWERLVAGRRRDHERWAITVEDRRGRSH